MDLKSIMDMIKDEPTITIRSRRGCRHCGCFLSVVQEEPTAFHVRRPNGKVDWVVVYRGKFYCRACHRYQVEE